MEDMMKQGMGMMRKMMGQDGAENNDGSMNNRMKHGMGMMKNMMGQGGQGSKDGISGMMQMCQNMTQSVAKSADMASFATEEIRELFQDWLGQVEAEVLTFITDNNGQIDIAAIANELSISEKSARYIVGVLFQRGALDLGQVHVTKVQTQQAPEDVKPVNLEASDTKDECN